MKPIVQISLDLTNIEEAFSPLDDQELEIFSFHLNEAVKEMAFINLC